MVALCNAKFKVGVLGVDGGVVQRLLAAPLPSRVSLVVIVVGSGLYGFSLGCWRAPELGLYVAVKMPLLILATVVANGFLNGLLSQLLGSGLGFRQTARLILWSFAIFSLLLASLTPVTLFMAWNTPGADEPGARQAHGTLLVLHTLIIAYAGTVANLWLLSWTLRLSTAAAPAVWTFLSWTAGNLFLGAQVAYVLRPFFGQPNLPVAFLRADALSGNFYLGVFASARQALGGASAAWLALAVVAVTAAILLHRAIRLACASVNPQTRKDHDPTR